MVLEDAVFLLSLAGLRFGAFTAAFLLVKIQRLLLQNLLSFATN